MILPTDLQYQIMGGKQSAISQEDLQQVESSHPEFKKIRVLSSQEGKALQVQFAVGDAKELEEWEREYRKLQEEECLFLPLEHAVERQFVCGTGGICKVTYPHYQYLLSDYIARCSSEDTLYEKEKLWYLAYQLIAAAAIFHGRGEKAGDLRPRNVFLNDFERVKVGNRLSWPHETTNYAKAIFEKEPAYLAPEEIKQISFGHNEPQTDFEKAESFSVGLTLLDRAVLCDSADLYNLATCRFDYQRLEERLAKLWELGHLDGLLKQVIEGLCRPNPAMRLTCRQLYAWLENYSHDILNKNELHLELPPFLTQPHPTSPALHPIPKNLYVESQVVSDFTGRFAQPEPLRELHVRQVVSSVVPPPQHPPPQHPPPSQYVPSPIDAAGQEDFSATLRKIEEQLQRSRKMFPS